MALLDDVDAYLSAYPGITPEDLKNKLASRRAALQQKKKGLSSSDPELEKTLAEYMVMDTPTFEKNFIRPAIEFHQQDARPTAKVAPEAVEDKGVLEGVGKYLHPKNIVEGLGQTVLHPLDSAMEMGFLGNDRLRQEAAKSFIKGDYGDWLRQNVSAAVPGYGTGVDSSLEKIFNGRPREGIGESLGLLTLLGGPKILKGAGRAASGASEVGANAVSKAAGLAGKSVTPEQVAALTKMSAKAGAKNIPGISNFANMISQIRKGAGEILNPAEPPTPTPVRPPPVTFPRGQAPVPAPPVQFRQPPGPQVAPPPVTFRGPQATPPVAPPPVTFPQGPQAPTPMPPPPVSFRPGQAPPAPVAAPPVRFPAQEPAAPLSSPVKPPPVTFRAAASEAESSAPLKKALTPKEPKAPPPPPKVETTTPSGKSVAATPPHRKPSRSAPAKLPETGNLSLMEQVEATTLNAKIAKGTATPSDIARAQELVSKYKR